MIRHKYVTFTEHDRNPVIHITSFSSGLLINPYGKPLLNTALLLTSGSFLTYAHLHLRLENFRQAKIGTAITILFGLMFFYFQFCEYLGSGFSINDGIYGSLFFVLTGFHGIHVIVGTIFLIVCLLRLFYSHFTAGNHFAFEAAA
jgi:cytochrome c oxidase subunit 3